jgi:hypothetical protein
MVKEKEGRKEESNLSGAFLLFMKLPNRFWLLVCISITRQSHFMG